MARRGHTLFTIVLTAGIFAAGWAHAQMLPDPSENRSYLIRGPGRVILYHLLPRRDHYDVFGRQSNILAAGIAKRLGNHLVIYNMRSHVIGVMRPELLPPDSEMSAVGVVRDSTGNEIGILSRY